MDINSHTYGSISNLAVPHGVADMSLDIAGLVETSNNLAETELKQALKDGKPVPEGVELQDGGVHLRIA